MTYLKAKKTLLQPIKTEVFKNQLSACTEVLEHFSGKSEVELREDLGFDDMFNMNVLYMYDQYARVFFDVYEYNDIRSYNETPHKRVSGDAVGRYVKIDDSHLREEDRPRQDTPSDPRVRAALWSDRITGLTHISESFVDTEKSIQKSINSPLIPTRLNELVVEYLDIANENVTILMKSINDNASKMPNKYPSLDKLNKSSFGWIHKDYVSNFKDLHDKSDEINAYLKSYFQSDNLLDQ